MEPNLLPRPVMILLCKGRSVIGLPKRQLRDRKDRSERSALGDGAVYVDGLPTFKDAVTMKIFLTYTALICSTVCLLAIYFYMK
jgi:hypothetical protein